MLKVHQTGQLLTTITLASQLSALLPASSGAVFTSSRPPRTHVHVHINRRPNQCFLFLEPKYNPISPAMSAASSSPSAVLPSRILLSLLATVTAAGGYYADWNESHVFNPRWPPHAKFHNGQTMSTGLGLGLLTFYYTWRTTNASTTSGLMDNLLTATLMSSLYWATQLSAILYPGAEWVDDEFKESYGAPQKKGAPVLLGLSWAAFGLGWYRVTNGGKIKI